MLRIASLLLFVAGTSGALQAQQFSAARPLLDPTAGGVQDVVTGDVDQDGDADIVIGTYGGRVGLYLNDGTGVFGEQVLLAEVGRVYQVALVDVDNDGLLDVTFANWGDPNVGWCRNLGGGLFATIGTLVDELQANTTCSIAWGDVDEDGDLDLLTTTYINDHLRYYRNEGGGEFSVQGGVAGVESAWHCDVGDIDNDGDLDVVGVGGGVTWRDSQNGGFMGQLPPGGGQIDWLGDLDAKGVVLFDPHHDGYPDIYVADGANDRIIRYANDGSLNFSLWGTESFLNDEALGVSRLKVADLDGDGEPDLLSAWSGDHTIRFHQSGWGPGYIVASDVYGASGMAVADVDGDGLPDLVSAAGSAGAVAVHRNLGGGLFTLSQTLTELSGIVRSTLQADLDSDGLPDVVVLFAGSNSLAWKRNLGQGTFGPITLIAEHLANAFQVLAADLDNDGDPDLVTSLDTDRIIWFRNEGNAVFTPPLVITNAFGVRSEFALGDLDNDGDTDLVSRNSESPYPLVRFMNTGNGNFDPPVTIASNLTNIRAVLVTDLDNDGAGEVLIARLNGPTQLYGNDGAGNFAPGVAVDANASEMLSLLGSDLDNDGNGDVLVVPLYGTKILRLLGNGDLTFQATDTIRLGSGATPYAVVLADLDRDGDPDLLSTGFNNEETIWLANDGTGTFAPAVTVDAPFYGYAMSAGDLDLDGDPDVVVGSSDRLKWYENFINSPYAVEGYLFLDDDADGIWDTDEVPFPYHHVSCAPSASLPYSNNTGLYRFGTNAGTYTITGSSANDLWASNPAERTVELSEVAPIASDQDFAYVPVVDTLVLGVSSNAGGVRCNQEFLRWIDITDQGTLQAEDLVVDLYLDPEEDVFTVEPPPTSVDGAHYQWVFGTLPHFGQRHIAFTSQAGTVGIGQFLRDSLVVSAHAGSTTTTWTHVHMRPLLCAFDPNDKQVYPPGFGQFGAVDIGTGALQYTIRFQNTGNDTAFTVVLRDRLHEALDPASIRIVGSSHTITAMQVDPDRELALTFDDILLPDSTTDLLGSQGYVVFDIDLVEGLPSGTAITNSVDIHFDLNVPVVTNTVLNTLIDCDLHQPVITLVDGALLQASPGLAYQWFLNGEAIPGADGRELLPSGPGEHTVEVLSPYGCRTLSPAYTVITTGMDAQELPGLVVLPNPVTDQARIILSAPLPIPATLAVIDAAGRTVRTLPANGTRELLLDRDGLADGLYVVRITGEGVPPLTARIVLAR